MPRIGQQGFSKNDPDAGVPKGNPSNFTKHKPIRDKLRRMTLYDDGKELEKICQALINKAKEGDVSAAKEYFDRIEGRSVRQLEAAVEGTLTISVDDAKL